MRRTAVALSVLLTAACGTSATPSGSSGESSAEPSASAAPAVPGIEAEIVRLRTDEAIGGQVQVRVSDTGDTPFAVTSVALGSPGVEPEPPTAVTADFVPGRVIDLRVPYGHPVCDARPLPAVAQLSVTRPDGAVEQLTVPAAAEVLERIHAGECAVLDVLAVVDIAVRDLHDDGDALAGTLVLTRRSGHEPVTATRLGRSVLVHPAVDLPLKLAGGEDTVSAPISFTLVSCEPHVLAETKKPFVFPLGLTVGNGDEVVDNLPLDQAARDQLTALVQRVCAAPS